MRQAELVQLIDRARQAPLAARRELVAIFAADLLLAAAAHAARSALPPTHRQTDGRTVRHTDTHGQTSTARPDEICWFLFFRFKTDNNNLTRSPPMSGPPMEASVMRRHGCRRQTKVARSMLDHAWRACALAARRR